MDKETKVAKPTKGYFRINALDFSNQKSWNLGCVSDEGLKKIEAIVAKENKK